MRYLLLLCCFGSVFSYSQKNKGNVNLELFNKYRVVADSLVTASDWSGAVEYHTKALQYKPNDHTSLFVRGISYIGMGDNRKAYKDFDYLISIADKNSGAYYWRAIASFNLDAENIHEEEYLKHPPCDDMKKSKELGYKGAFDGYTIMCPDL